MAGTVDAPGASSTAPYYGPAFGPGYQSQSNNPGAGSYGGNIQNYNATLPVQGSVTQPSGGNNNGGGGGGNNNNNSNQNSHVNPSTGQWDDNWYAQQHKNASDELAARNAQIQTDIGNAYQPIFDELDKQIGGLPAQQDAANKQVGDLAAGQVGDINAQAAIDTGDLNQNISNENNQANMNLHSLASNIQNMLKGAGFYLGAVGAGNSSAAGDYTTAITNNADKTRGMILNSRDMANNQITQKISDVQKTASKNVNDVDTWKNNQLSNILQTFQGQLNQLGMAKAQAKGQEGQDIANLRQSALDNFYGRLKQLDDTVNNYKMTINQWQTERAGWLQDQLTLMNQGAQYNSNSGGQQSAAIQSLLNANNSQQNNIPQSNISSVPGSGSANQAGSNPLQSLVGGIGNILQSGVSGLSNLFSGQQQ